MPPGLEIVGWPTGAPHDVGGLPYGRARAAAFMGKRIVEEATGRTWSWVSELPQAAVDEFPTRSTAPPSWSAGAGPATT